MTSAVESATGRRIQPFATAAIVSIAALDTILHCAATTLGSGGVALGCYGLWRLLRAEQLREYRFIAVTFVVLYVLFVITAGRPYYLSGLYAPLAAAGALGFQRRREAGHDRRRLASAAVAFSVALASGVLVLSISLTRSDVGEQIARRTADAYHALPVERQSRTAIVGESYIIAAYVDGYSDRYRLPGAFSLSRSYGYFAAPSAELDAVLYIGRDPGPLRPYFDTSRVLADVSATTCTRTC